MECTMCKKSIPAIKVTVFNKGVVGECIHCGSTVILGTLVMSELESVLSAQEEETEEGR
jgi:hypothetical protein